MNANTKKYENLLADFLKFKKEKLQLDLTRGKPSPEQLDLSNRLDGILDGNFHLRNGVDARNYGGILGIPEARELGAEILGSRAKNTLVGGNSSLNLMYHFVASKVETWGEGAKFICLTPGYDRHFKICEHFGISMLGIPLTSRGPDMGKIEEAVRTDRSIKGIWCVPKYSNPTGETYSDEVVKRMAALPKIAGEDFFIFWDNAYAVHDLQSDGDKLYNFSRETENQGTSDYGVIFASTSKITFAGAGISFLSTGDKTLSDFEKYLGTQMIGFDKVNQLRHVKFLSNLEETKRLMAKHREILKPKFDLVLDTLEKKLGKSKVAKWTYPKGGYFISLDTLPGLAKRTVQLALELGVRLTPAGATFPYGEDPNDSNIRIAPSYPKLEELKKAADVLGTCILLAKAESDNGES